MTVAVAIDADVNPPPSIPLEDNYNLQAPLLIGKMGGNAVRAHPYYPHDTRLMNSRSKLLRGGDSPIVVSSRAIQEVVPTQTISRGGNTNTTFTTTTTLSSSSSSSSSPSISDSTSDLAITIFCFLIIAPCCLASIGQLIYTCHKRKRARMERQLLAVSTNPTSRMLILSEILKNDCRPVTKDQASSKKNRVLVKKYRKKTPSEQRLWRSRSDRHREKEGGGVPAVIEAEGTTNQDNRNGDNVSSSWDIMEDGRIETGRDEALGTEAGFVSSESKPVIVYFSEDVIHRFSSREGSSPSAELDNVSTLEEETTASISYVHEADEEVGLMGGNAPSTPIENRECTTVLGGGVGSDEEIKMKSDKYEMNSITTDGHQMKKNHERMASESVIHQPPDTPQSHEIKMDRPDIQFPSIVAVTPTYSPTDSAHIQPHSTKCTEGAASMDESSAIPKIPLLNIIVATPTKYPDRRAESMLAVESDAMQKSPGVFCVPDLSDDEDSCGRGGVNNAPEMRSIFRQGQYNYDAEVVAAEVGGISEIQACASSDTEVASNIDGLKEQMDSFFVESPRNVPSPFLQYLSDAVNNDVSNSTEWDIPLQKVESYKSTTDKSLSSHVSYFSYEDVSIASDELETCAICLCPYEEGDVRIFSKRCPHAFHKECILEWLVKSQNCPCCRIDIVTKSEIDEISASLIGTKRLAEAMAVSEMQEAPPFSVRRSRLARQLMTRARAAQRLRHSGPTSLRPIPASPRTPRANNVTHGRDRFLRATSGFLSPPSPSFLAPPINPSRSSDAIMNPHETNQLNTVSGTSNNGRGGGAGASIHTSNAGSLFTTSVNQSMFHDHWIRQRQTPPPPMNISLSPSTPHPYWRQHQQVQHHSPTDNFFRV